MPELQNNTERALVVSSLWLYSGFVGATALAAGLLELFDGEPSRWALGMAFFGGALAAASWRRARTILEQAERVSAIATDAPTEATPRAIRKQTRPRRDSHAAPQPIAIGTEAR